MPTTHHRVAARGKTTPYDAALARAAEAIEALRAVLTSPTNLPAVSRAALDAHRAAGRLWEAAEHLLENR